MASITEIEENVNSELELITNTGEILQDFSNTGKKRKTVEITQTRKFKAG